MTAARRLRAHLDQHPPTVRVQLALLLAAHASDLAHMPAAAIEELAADCAGAALVDMGVVSADDVAATRGGPVARLDALLWIAPPSVRKGTKSRARKKASTAKALPGRARILDNGDVLVASDLADRIARTMLLAFKLLGRQSSGGWRPDVDLAEAAAVLQRARLASDL